MRYSNGIDEIYIREADIGDIPQIVSLYNQVAITRDNYLVKLNEGEASFANTGGMFIINNEETLKRILSLESEKLLIGLLNGEICGFIWLTVKGDSSEYDNISYYPLMDSYREILESENRENIISPCGEIVAIGPSIKGVLSFIFFNSVMKYLDEIGFPYHMGEVYQVLSYDDENGHKDVNLLNEKSYYLLQKSGGVIIGEAESKRIEMDGFTVNIRPKVAFFDTKKCSEITRCHLEEKGWKEIY